MLIYNTTYFVAERQYSLWAKWIHEEHIPFMLKCGFEKPQVAKVLSPNSEQEGTSVTVQFHIGDMQQLNLWNEQHAENILSDMVKRFGADVLAFSTILELL